MPKRPAKAKVVVNEIPSNDDEGEEVVIPPEYDDEEDSVPRSPAKKQKMAVLPPPKKARNAPVHRPAGDGPSTSGSGKDTEAASIGRVISQAVIRAVNSRSGLPLSALAPRLRDPHDLLVSELSRALQKAESSSALITGPAGSGKTLLANTVVESLRRHFDGQGGRRELVVVTLHGLVHAGTGTDARVAVKEVAKQLCAANGLPFDPRLTLDEDLRFLAEAVGQMPSAGKVILFVLEDFDRFAPRHARQTLLYTLLDLVHLPRVGSGILGVTVAQNAPELLEKRVKSRFSHRSVCLKDFEPRPAAALMDDDEADRDHVEEACRTLGAMLGVSDELLGAKMAEEEMEGIDKKALGAAVALWNKSVDAALGMSKTRLKAEFELLVGAGGDEGAATAGALASLAMRCVRDLDRDAPRLDPRVLKQALDAAAGPSAAPAAPAASPLASLSPLDLLVLVSVYRLSYLRRRTTVNLREAFQEYRDTYLANVDRTPDTYPRDALLPGLERLIKMGICSVDGSRDAIRGVPKDFRPVRLLLERQAIRRGLEAHPRCSTYVRRWFDDVCLQGRDKEINMEE